MKLCNLKKYLQVISKKRYARHIDENDTIIKNKNYTNPSQTNYYY